MGRKFIASLYFYHIFPNHPKISNTNILSYQLCVRNPVLLDNFLHRILVIFIFTNLILPAPLVTSLNIHHMFVSHFIFSFFKYYLLLFILKFYILVNKILKSFLCDLCLWKSCLEYLLKSPNKI